MDQLEILETSQAFLRYASFVSTWIQARQKLFHQATPLKVRMLVICSTPFLPQGEDESWNFLQITLCHAGLWQERVSEIILPSFSVIGFGLTWSAGNL